LEDFEKTRVFIFNLDARKIEERVEDILRWNFKLCVSYHDIATLCMSIDLSGCDE